MLNDFLNYLQDVLAVFDTANFVVTVIGTLIIVMMMIPLPLMMVKEKNEKVIDFLKKHAKIFHPNKICLFRMMASLPMAALMYWSLYNYNPLIHSLTVLLYTFWFTTDKLDGTLAKNVPGWDTPFGKWWDAGSDKAFVWPALLVMAIVINNPIITAFVVIIILCDLYGQVFRSGKSTGATWWGKWKTTMCMVTLTVTYVLFPHGLCTNEIVYVLLGTSTLLAIKSASQKFFIDSLKNPMKHLPKKHLENLLDLCRNPLRAE